jgi:8-oxo-dGTP pyrophosphatase MutT (NUDIX family)
VKFEAARSRVASLPGALPPAPRELAATLVAPDDGSLPRVPRFPATTSRDAAVLVLLYPGAADEAFVVLTERSSGGHRHAGQVSLPGGAIDPGESVVEAALREAREEVGLDVHQAGVTVVGSFEPVDVRVSSFRIHTVVAVAQRLPALEADEREVAALIEAPLSAFMPGAPIEFVTGERDGLRLRYGGYPVAGYHVWGATARILGGLGAVLADGTARS